MVCRYQTRKKIYLRIGEILTENLVMEKRPKDTLEKLLDALAKIVGNKYIGKSQRVWSKVVGTEKNPIGADLGC